MSLIPTHVVDKNGRATTVHKRSGPSVSESNALKNAKPKIQRAPKKMLTPKVDEPFRYTIDKEFAASPFGIILNRLRPDLKLDRNDLRFANDIHVSTREVYSIARYGFSVRDSIYFAHFKLTPEEAMAVADEVQRSRGKGKVKYRERPWMDAMLEADIDHRTLLTAYSNGLSQGDLDEMPVHNAPDAITAYTYKGFSKTALAEGVRDGKVPWDGIKSIGVTRATKNDWTIKLAMERPATSKGPFPLSYETLGDIIKDIEKHPRTSLSDRYQMDAEYFVASHAALYRRAGERFWDFHMPETLEQISRIPGAKEDAVDYALYCDEVIHTVRSNPGIAETVISADKGRSNSRPYGSYAGQYAEDQRDPIWRFHELVAFRDAGLTVDECVHALSQGLDAERAKGVFKEGISIAVSDGWL